MDLETKLARIEALRVEAEAYEKKRHTHIDTVHALKAQHLRLKAEEASLRVSERQAEHDRQIAKIAAERLLLHQLEERRRAADELLVVLSAQQNALDDELRMRSRSAESVKAILQRTAVLKGELERGKFDVSRINEIGAHWDSSSRDTQLVLNILRMRAAELQEARTERSRDIEALNAQRAELDRKREAVRKQQQELAALQMRGQQVLVEMELGNAPPREYLLANAELPEIPMERLSIDQLVGKTREALGPLEQRIQEMQQQVPVVEDQGWRVKFSTYEPWERDIVDMAREVVDSIVDIAAKELFPYSLESLAEERRIAEEQLAAIDKKLEESSTRERAQEAFAEITTQVCQEMIEQIYHEHVALGEIAVDLSVNAILQLILQKTSVAEQRQFLLENAFTEMRTVRATRNEQNFGHHVLEVGGVKSAKSRRSLKKKSAERDEHDTESTVLILLEALFRNPMSRYISLLESSYWDTGMRVRGIRRVMTDGNTLCATGSPDGRYLALGTPKGVKVYDADMSVLASVSTSSAPIDVAWSRDGFSLAFCTAKTVSILRLSDASPRPDPSISVGDVSKQLQVSKADVRPTGVCFHPCLNVTLGQPCVVVGLSNGDIIKWNFDAVGAQNAVLFPCLTDPVPVFESFRAHKKAVVAFGFSSADTMFSLDLVGHVFLWRYEQRSFTGYGWFQPDLKFRVELDVATFAHAKKSSFVPVFPWEARKGSYKTEFDDYNAGDSLLKCLLGRLKIGFSDKDSVLDLSRGRRPWLVYAEADCMVHIFAPLSGSRPPPEQDDAFVDMARIRVEMAEIRRKASIEKRRVTKDERMDEDLSDDDAIDEEWPCGWRARSTVVQRHVDKARREARKQRHRIRHAFHVVRTSADTGEIVGVASDYLLEETVRSVVVNACPTTDRRDLVVMLFVPALAPRPASVRLVVFNMIEGTLQRAIEFFVQAKSSTGMALAVGPRLHTLSSDYAFCLVENRMRVFSLLTGQETACNGLNVERVFDKMVPEKALMLWPMRLCLFGGVPAAGTFPVVDEASAEQHRRAQHCGSKGFRGDDSHLELWPKDGRVFSIEGEERQSAHVLIADLVQGLIDSCVGEG